jgi:phosphoglycolate phosphatase
MKWDLIIFDCDGVLVDSEPIASRIFYTMLREIGVSISFEQTVREFEGRTDEDCLQIATRYRGKPLPDDFLEHYYERVDEAFRTELRPVPGVVEALKAISAPVCVASSGPLAKMRLTLGITELLAWFEGRLFSAENVERGKPYPDIFLYAAEKLNVSPGDCAVVEDSVFGVQAGVAAGMRVFGYAQRSEAKVLEKAGAKVFEQMTDLPLLLGYQSS